MDVEGQDYDIVKGFMDTVWCPQCTVEIPTRYSTGAMQKQYVYAGRQLRPLVIMYEENIFSKDEVQGENISAADKASNLRTALNDNGYIIRYCRSGDIIALHKGFY